MTIALDFDGTCVTHEFPRVGNDIGAVPVLKELIKNGHWLVLFTMRSDIDDPVSSEEKIHPVGGKYLTDAINWFTENEITLHGVQYNPTQHTWTKSNKCYAHLYIDDAALGAPLNFTGHQRPFIDWIAAREMLIGMGLIKL